MRPLDAAARPHASNCSDLTRSRQLDSPRVPYSVTNLRGVSDESGQAILRPGSTTWVVTRPRIRRKRWWFRFRRHVSELVLLGWVCRPCYTKRSALHRSVRAPGPPPGRGCSQVLSAPPYG